MRQQVIDLLEKVERMRSAQKDYFKKGRQSADLVRSKQLEIEVDQELPAMINRLKTKP